MFVIIFLVRKDVTIYLLSSGLRLSTFDIIKCIGSSTRYISNSQNKYAFTASTFLETLKFCSRI